MTLVLVVHGTRDPAGGRTSERLLCSVRAALPGTRVELAFADVRGPAPATVLAGVPDPAVVLPVFLATGYHVRVDLPAQLGGFPDATVLPALGPAGPLVAAVRDRLAEAGHRPGDRVVLAAAGSSDRRARAEVGAAADRLATLLGAGVRIGYCATAEPALARAVADARQRGGRVAIASWLLAPGLFHRAAQRTGADLVGAPIGDHPRLVALIADRYHRAAAAHRPAAPLGHCVPGATGGPVDHRTG